jgi:hypothetical protein
VRWHIAAALLLAMSPSWGFAATHGHRSTRPPATHQPKRPSAVLPFALGEVPSAQSFSPRALSPCPEPNPNLAGPPNFRDGCPLPAAGINLAAPLASPAFTGTVTVNGLPIGSGAPGPPGAPATPGGANGALQYNNGGALGGYAIGTSFGFVNGGQTIDLASGAACFNLGPWSGDLTGAACTAPALSSGSAARNLGSPGGALTGSWSNLSLVPSSVFSSMGAPGGDLSGSSYAAPKVSGIGGFPVALTPPMPQSALVWNGTNYAPAPISPGINLTTGDVVCGPGTGTQPCAIQPAVVTNQKLAQGPAATIKGNPGAAPAQEVDLSVSGGLGFNGNGALVMVPTGVVAQQISVSSPSAATNCWSVGADGRVVSITAGACGGSGGGISLTATDGTTLLLATDNSTQLIVGSSAPAGCATSGVAKQNVACNSAFMALFRM